MNGRPLSGSAGAALDVRVWVLAAADLSVGKRPFPEVLASFALSWLRPYIHLAVTAATQRFAVV